MLHYRVHIIHWVLLLMESQQKKIGKGRGKEMQTGKRKNEISDSLGRAPKLDTQKKNYIYLSSKFQLQQDADTFILCVHKKNGKPPLFDGYHHPERSFF